MMKEKGYGYAFVDDTDLLQVLSLASKEFIVNSMQEAVETWEKELKITGGVILPDKTFWYLIDFKWVNGAWSYKTVADSPGSLYVNDI